MRAQKAAKRPKFDPCSAPPLNLGVAISRLSSGFITAAQVPKSPTIVIFPFFASAV